MYDFDEIKKVDSEIADAIKKEMERQNSHIELIASENCKQGSYGSYVARFDQQVCRRYPAEGMVEAASIDVCRDLARERAKKPVWMRLCQRTCSSHSGAQATIWQRFEIVMLTPGDKVRRFFEWDDRFRITDHGVIPI